MCVWGGVYAHVFMHILRGMRLYRTTFLKAIPEMKKMAKVKGSIFTLCNGD